MRTDNTINDYNLKAIAYKIAAGDQQAFRLFFNHFAARLTEFAHAMLNSKEAATEVADDVLVKIWKNRERLPEIKNLRVYVYTATKNTALNYLSRRAREIITEPFDHISIQLRDEYCPEQLMMTKEIFKKMHEAVADLPPRCKMIFKLVREDGLKYKEVAEILKISVKTVDAQMVIAVKKISETMGGYFNGFPNRTVKKINKFS